MSQTYRTEHQAEGEVIGSSDDRYSKLKNVLSDLISYTRKGWSSDGSKNTSISKGDQAVLLREFKEHINNQFRQLAEDVIGDDTVFDAVLVDVCETFKKSAQPRRQMKKRKGRKATQARVVPYSKLVLSNDFLTKQNLELTNKLATVEHENVQLIQQRFGLLDRVKELSTETEKKLAFPAGGSFYMNECMVCERKFSGPNNDTLVQEQRMYGTTELVMMVCKSDACTARIEPSWSHWEGMCDILPDFSWKDHDIMIPRKDGSQDHGRIQHPVKDKYRQGSHAYLGILNKTVMLMVSWPSTTFEGPWAKFVPLPDIRRLNPDLPALSVESKDMLRMSEEFHALLKIEIAKDHEAVDAIDAIDALDAVQQASPTIAQISDAVQQETDRDHESWSQETQFE